MLSSRHLSHHSTNELSLNRLFGHSLALITQCRSFSRHLTDESSLDRRVVTRSTSRHSTGESSLDRRVLSRPFCSHLTVLSPHDCSVITSTDESSLDRRACSDLFLAVTRLATLAVTRLALLRSLDSLLAVTRLAPCGHSTRTLAVTRLALLRSLAVPLFRSLDSHSCGHSQLHSCGHSTCSLRSLASLSRSHSARIALLQSLGLLVSLEHDVILRRHVLP
ncbi:hypothetical protein YC2023_033631 [Brassica napus]